MANLLGWMIPGWVLLLVAVAAYEFLIRRRRGKRLSSTFADEFTAMFYGTKRMELDHRETTSMLRDEQDQGAPPLVGLDLDRQTAVLRPNNPDR